MNILLIEDTNKEALAIKQELDRVYATTLLSGHASFRYMHFIRNFDLVIVNYLFCKTDKISICKAIRNYDPNIPIMVLGRTYNVSYKVSLLDSGADDFLIKPFAVAELHARVRALLRRRKKSSVHTLLRVQDLIFDTATKKAFRGKKYLPMRPKEIKILEYLLENAGRVISRGMILDHVWNGDYETYENVVAVHMKHLRDKIDGGFPNKLIKTVYGFGYTIE
ncbi:MAG: response regulator transcription factor [Microgenomates group bacterium]